MTTTQTDPPTRPLGLPDESGKTDALPIVFSAILFCVLSIWMATASNGFLEADSITHYLARRFALSEPAHLVSVWTRPFCVALYAIPAHFGGLVGTRLMSLALVMAMLAVTLIVNRRLNFTRAAFVAIFLLTQPLLFAHSFSELTEIPFALLLICCFLAYQRKQFLILTLLATLAPLARPEGFGLMLVTAFALLAHRRWWWTPILPLGLVAWSWAGWHVYGGPSEYPWWRWLPENWPYSGDSAYGHGSIFWLSIILPAVIGPMAFPLAWIGACCSLSLRARVRERGLADAQVLPGSKVDGSTVLDDRSSEASPAKRALPFARFFHDHDYRCRALIALIPLGILAGHSVLWALGKMASNGEPRYLLIVAPFWALLAAKGYEWVCNHVGVRRPLLWTVFAAIAPIAANFAYPSFPIGPADDDKLSDQVCAWLETQSDLRQQYPLFGASLPHIFVQIDRDRLDKKHVVDSSRKTVTAPPPGVMLVWDPIYSAFNSDERFVVSEQLLRDNGWTPIARFDQQTRYAIVYLSPSPAAK